MKIEQYLKYILIPICMVAFAFQSNGASIKVSGLRCEYLPCEIGRDGVKENPIVITENQKPRLSWVIESTSNQPKRGIYQASYQIIVSSSLENLNKNYGDLWDTGKVNSEESIHIEYYGKPLKSAQDCFWKVRVWDQNGDVSPYSKPARWTMDY
jgi:alpha-L-rhamnosidase